MTESEKKIQEIDQQIKELKGKATEELKKRLLESAAQTAALGYLLMGDKYLSFGRKKAPVVLPGEQAKAYRDQIERLVGDQIPIPKQVAGLRKKRNELKVSG